MVYSSNTVSATTEPEQPSFESRRATAAEINEEHGYYYSGLSDDDKIQYDLAAKEVGLGEEIKLLKTKIYSMQVLQPFNFALLGRFVQLLERLKKTHARLFNPEREADSEKKLDNISDKLSPSFGGPMNRAMRRAIARG